MVGPKPGITFAAKLIDCKYIGRLTLTPFSSKSLNIHFFISPSPGYPNNS